MKTSAKTAPSGVLSGKHRCPDSGASFSFLQRFSRFLKEHPLAVLWIIAGAGTLIRLVVSIQLLQNDPAVSVPVKESDMATYIAAADAILRGKLPEHFYYQPFYYAVFLPLCRMFGGGIPGAAVTAVIQSFLGGGIIFLAGDCARRISGTRAAFWTAVLTAFPSILIYFTPYALLEVLQAFWLILLLDLLLKAVVKPSFTNWSAVGVVLGCSILTRGNTWFFLPLILAVLFLIRKPLLSAGRKWFYAVLLLGFMILPQIPFAAYNSMKDGTLRGPSTAGGAVLALGNNPEAMPAGLELPYPPAYEEWMKTEKNISIPRRIFDFAVKEPGAWIEFKCRQFLLFWTSVDYPNNISEEYNAVKSPIMKNLRFISTGVLLALGLAGFFAGFLNRYFLRRKGFLLLWGMILLYALSVTAFYILARFRLPVLPLVCISGGVFLGRLLRKHPARVFLRYALAFAAGSFTVYVAYPLYASSYEPYVMRMVRPRGVRLLLNDPAFQGQHFTGKFISIADCGPFGHDPWLCTQPSESLVLEKDFSLSPQDFGICDLKNAGIIIPVYCSVPADLAVSVNGKNESFHLEPSRTGMNFLVLGNVPLSLDSSKPHSARIRIAFSGDLNAIGIFLDPRRDYGRTFMNGKAASCEFVVRLLLPVSAEKTDL